MSSFLQTSAFSFGPTAPPVSAFEEPEGEKKEERSIWGGVWNEASRRAGAGRSFGLLARRGDADNGLLIAGSDDAFELTPNGARALHRLLRRECEHHSLAPGGWFPLFDFRELGAQAKAFEHCGIWLSTQVDLPNGEMFWPVLGFADKTGVVAGKLEAAAQSLALAAVAGTRELGLQHSLLLMGRMADELRPGLLILDARQRIVMKNAAAASMLRERSIILQNLDGRLMLADAAAMKSLQAIMEQFASGGIRGETGLPDRYLPVSTHDEAALITLRQATMPTFTTSPATALLLVSRVGNEFPSVDLTGLFGLLPSEARFVCELMRTGSIQCAAARLTLSEGTARTYLKRVYAKIGVNNQLELARLILGLAPELAPRTAAQEKQLQTV